MNAWQEMSMSLSSCPREAAKIDKGSPMAQDKPERDASLVHPQAYAFSLPGSAAGIQHAFLDA